MIRLWLCRHGWHHWTPNSMGGSRPWCNWGGHWNEGWVFCEPCGTYYPPKSAHALRRTSASKEPTGE